VLIATVRVVLGDRDPAIGTQEVVQPGPAALIEFVGDLEKALLEATNMTLHVSRGKYRQGSDIFDMIEIFASAEAVRRFLISYPSLRKGIVALWKDVEAIVKATAKQFAKRKGKSLTELRFRGRLRPEKSVSTRPRSREVKSKRPGFT
jgi:hypothetical protein